MGDVYRGPDREDFKRAAMSEGHPRPRVKIVRRAGASTGGFEVHKGALHRALGVPEGSKIPKAKIRAALKSQSQHVRAMARSALGLEAM